MPLLKDLWSRVRDYFSGLFRRKLPEPGKFVADTKLSWKGFVATAPFVAPQREYLAYVPAGVSGGWTWQRHPLLVLIHGCRQTPEVVAEGTRITRLADKEGMLVLLPRQNPRANVWGCWNWFDGATARGWGESAIVAAQIRAVRRSYRINRRRVVVAGMSSGGALAAAIGLRYPELVAGVVVHSGIACGAASSAYAALGVGKNGADTDTLAIAAEARDDADAGALPVPLLVIQGSADDVVAPINAIQLVRQYLRFNGHPASAVGAVAELPASDHAATVALDPGRAVTTTEWRAEGRLVVRHVLVVALGHAWSGGKDTLPYNDPLPPDATALLGAFVREVAA